MPTTIKTQRAIKDLIENYLQDIIDSPDCYEPDEIKSVLKLWEKKPASFPKNLVIQQLKAADIYPFKDKFSESIAGGFIENALIEAWSNIDWDAFNSSCTNLVEKIKAAQGLS